MTTTPAPGLERVRLRRLVLEAPTVVFPLHPGDRALVEPGEAIVPGGPLLERTRAASLHEIPARSVPSDARSGDRWAEEGRRAGARRGRSGPAAGELLAPLDGTWLAIVGDRSDVVEAPVAGVVRGVRPGIGIVVATEAFGIPGVAAAGGPSRGRLEIAVPGPGELRPAALDIRRAGTVLVAGARVDAETLTRARAMGVRGILAGAIATRELHGLAASEARQRASLQPIPPFTVLATEGHQRSPMPSPLLAILGALAGREVALVGDPPLLLFARTVAALPSPEPGLVRIRAGAEAGREGRWLGLTGPRRFVGGIRLEGGLVDVGEGAPIAIPLVDLERFA